MELFEQEKEETRYFLKFLYRYRLLLLVTFLVSASLSILITSFIPVKYKSTGIIYPVSSHSTSPIGETRAFGSDVETEQLLQLLESESIMNKSISKFNLSAYYNIDTNQIQWQEDLFSSFKNDVRFIRTKYNSVMVTATTKEPKLSADIANYLMEAVSEFRSEIFKENIQKEYDYNKDQYEAQQKIFTDLTNRIYTQKDTNLPSDLLYNYFLRSEKKETPTDEYVNTPLLEHLVNEYKFAQQKLFELKLSYTRAKEQLEKPFYSDYIIDMARPSYRKSSPSFRTNIIIAVFGSLFIMVLILLARDRILWFMKEEIK